MKENSEKNFANEEKERKTFGEIVSKILTVICAIAAVVLIGVTAFALISANKDKNSDAGTAAPGIIDSTASTTEASTTKAPDLSKLPSAEGLKVKGDVYAKAQADIRAEASAESEIVGKLDFADAIGFVSVDENGWCKVVYQGYVCYVHRDYLSTKKPQSEPSSTEAGTSASESDTSVSESGSTTESTSKQDASSTSATASTSQPAEQTDGRKVIKLDQKHWTVVVVDKNRQIPEGYEPEIEYVAGSDCALDKRIAKYYNDMYNAALADGVELVPYSGYRSVVVQERNYNALVADYASQGLSQSEAEAKAATEILPAGSSEHNLGFAMDICGTEESFKDTEQYKWLCENAYKYGFIERYPEGKQDITGVIPEPWHWRFIGPAYAKDMKARGAETLEEYLQSYNAKY